MCYNIQEVLQDVKDWRAANFFKLIEEKTEVLVFVPNSNLVSERLKDTWQLQSLKRLKSLGFIFDSELKMDKQINSVVRSSFFYLTLSKN